MPSQGQRRRVVVSARMGLTAPGEVPGTSTQLPPASLTFLDPPHGCEVLENFESVAGVAVLVPVAAWQSLYITVTRLVQ